MPVFSQPPFLPASAALSSQVAWNPLLTAPVVCLLFMSDVSVARSPHKATSIDWKTIQFSLAQLAPCCGLYRRFVAGLCGVKAIATRPTVMCLKFIQQRLMRLQCADQTAVGVILCLSTRHLSREIKSDGTGLLFVYWNCGLLLWNPHNKRHNIMLKAHRMTDWSNKNRIY